jgi:hypothetical protein
MPTIKIKETDIYPPGLLRLLESAPSAGNGLNKWVIRAATALQGYASYDDAYGSLLMRTIAAGRPKHEAQREVRRALNAVSGFSGERAARKAPKDEPDDFTIDRIVLHGNDEVSAHDRLIASSPSMGQPDSSGRRTVQILRVLFPGNPFLCFGFGAQIHDCMRLDEWIATERPGAWEFIVPCEQKARTGLTAEGKESMHALSNCGERRYLVAEFDFPEDRWSEHGIDRLDGQSALILYLAKSHPLVAVVDSKGKSLHAWFYVEGKTEPEVCTMFAEFLRLGACPTTLTKSQFVRMPDGTRSQEKGRGVLQRALFLDRAAIGRSA